MNCSLVIGVGNEFRGDDAAGLVVARKLAERASSSFCVIELVGEASALLDLWKDAGAVILIDAVTTGSPPGTILEIDARSDCVPFEPFQHSTHAFGLAQAIALAKAMNSLPASCRIYGIEAKSFEWGAGLSPAVDAAIESLTAHLRCILQGMVKESAATFV